MGDRKNAAYTNEKVGIIYYQLVDYYKAKEYLHNALGIRIQIGDKEGDVISHGNLIVNLLLNMTKRKNILRKHLPLKNRFRLQVPSQDILLSR